MQIVLYINIMKRKKGGEMHQANICGHVCGLSCSRQSSVVRVFRLWQKVPRAFRSRAQSPTHVKCATSFGKFAQVCNLVVGTHCPVFHVEVSVFCACFSLLALDSSETFVASGFGIGV